MSISKAPASLRVIGWLALFWNLVGVVMFIMQTGLTTEQIAAMPEERRMVYEAMPPWLTVAYAVGVFGGTLGSFGLLVRKRWAVIAFGASLLAVVANMVGVCVHTPAWEISGAAGLPLGILLIAIAAFLFWYARRAAARGWIG
ncbi:MAG: hypothetical protein GX805_04265 [Gammaproteobacteria bacterium]|nr:hypothetical protein [Gammaproteobacteria bacterium]